MKRKAVWKKTVLLGGALALFPLAEPEVFAQLIWKSFMVRWITGLLAFDEAAFMLRCSLIFGESKR